MIINGETAHKITDLVIRVPEVFGRNSQLHLLCEKPFNSIHPNLAISLYGRRPLTKKVWCAIKHASTILKIGVGGYICQSNFRNIRYK
jgi:hypothetical protein